MLMLSNTNEIVHILMGGCGAAGSLQLLLFSGHFIYGGSHKHAGCCWREEEGWRGLMQISDRGYIFRICTLLHLKLKICTGIVFVATYECVCSSASKRSIRRFIITEKAPTRAFSWLKAATTAFTFKTLLRHYAKLALTPR